MSVRASLQLNVVSVANLYKLFNFEQIHFTLLISQLFQYNNINLRLLLQNILYKLDQFPLITVKRTLSFSYRTV